MKLLLVQPSRLQPDGSVYKNKARWLLGMTLPYLAALAPPGVEVEIKDDLYDDVPFDRPHDLVGLTCMSHQASRAYQIADEFRRRGIPVVLGGFHATLAPEEALRHADAVVVGEAEGVWPRVLEDAATGRLRGRYQSLMLSDLKGLPAPRYDLIENAQAAIDDLIDVMGRATIEAVPLMSAQQAAGPKRQGKKTDRQVVNHGSQTGRVALKERQLRVTKPRLRKKAAQPGEPGEVEIPAYEAMQKDARLADRMLEILINGVSTRRYEAVLPAMAENFGVSRSEVSREAIEAGERLLKGLAERDFSGIDIVAVWIDGLQLGSYHVICAVGVDAHGHKHVLGLREGATENAVVAKALLDDLVARGLDPTRRRLFVIDGAKALRTAIDAAFGGDTPVQRCRNHKVRNVVGHLPKGQYEQAKATLKAAFKLDAKEGMAKIEQYATWLEHDHPGAAASLREGLEEMFTINRLGLPSELRRRLGTTNLIDNGHSAAAIGCVA